jgi:hypothetical protein
MESVAVHSGNGIDSIGIDVDFRNAGGTSR